MYPPTRWQKMFKNINSRKLTNSQIQKSIRDKLNNNI